jgi:hypothetical protein
MDLQAYEAKAEDALAEGVRRDVAALDTLRAFALPLDLYRSGVRRYGFHGLSYEYIASRLPELAPGIAGGRVVVAFFILNADCLNSIFWIKSTLCKPIGINILKVLQSGNMAC